MKIWTAIANVLLFIARAVSFLILLWIVGSLDSGVMSGNPITITIVIIILVVCLVS